MRARSVIFSAWTVHRTLLTPALLRVVALQTSLFSLAVSDVLIFNIHEKDIGLYNASSYSL